MDLSTTLMQKSNQIVERWVSAVFDDQQIEVTQELTFKEVRDSLPRVLRALASVLSESETSDLQTLVDASLEHGEIRAEQGFEPSEIAREYRLLRFVTFAMLEDDLMQVSSSDMLRAVRLIDMVIDEAIARCFDSYTRGRMHELRQLQNQLNLTNQELTRLVRASRENLAQLAHELKTPLTSIIGYADLFLRQQREQPSIRDTSANLDSIERVLRSGRLLLRLINDALEIARYDAGKMKLQPIATDPRQLIDSIVEMIEPLARDKNLSLQIDYDRAPAEVVIDPLRLQQVLTNLLSNAVRYTQMGSVKLSVWTVSPQTWAISIVDSGDGIPPEAQAHIFDPYFRAEPAIVTASDGTGLGLAIVDRLVQLMQGKITLKSQPEQGSTFTVTLPIDLSLPAPTP